MKKKKYKLKRWTESICTTTMMDGKSIDTEMKPIYDSQSGGKAGIVAFEFTKKELIKE